MKITPLYARLALFAALFAQACLAHATPTITSVVESGGDGGQIAAQYTGQTYANTGGLGTVTLGLFGEDAPAYTDRDFQWNSVLNNSSVAIGMPSYLVNGEYIAPGNDRRDNSAYTLTITVSQPAFVYLLIDNRGSAGDNNASDPPDLGTGVNSLSQPFMQWVLTSGFTAVKTGKNRTGSTAVPDEVGIDESAPSLGVGPGVSVDNYVSVYQKSVPAGSFVLGEYGIPTNTGRDMYGVVIRAVPEPSSICLLSIGAFGFLTYRPRRIVMVWALAKTPGRKESDWPAFPLRLGAFARALFPRSCPSSAWARPYGAKLCFAWTGCLRAGAAWHQDSRQSYLRSLPLSPSSLFATLFS